MEKKVKIKLTYGYANNVIINSYKIMLIIMINFITMKTRKLRAEV